MKLTLTRQSRRLVRERIEQERMQGLDHDLALIAGGPCVYLLIADRQKPMAGQTVYYYPNPSGYRYILSVSGEYRIAVPQTEVPPAFWYSHQPKPGLRATISRARMSQLRRDPRWAKRQRNDVPLDRWARVPLADGPAEPAGGVIPELETPLSRMMRLHPDIFPS